jgi:hypothetical protein
MERNMGTKSWRYNRKIILLENIRTIRVPKQGHNIRNIGVQVQHRYIGRCGRC